MEEASRAWLICFATLANNRKCGESCIAISISVSIVGRSSIIAGILFLSTPYRTEKALLESKVILCQSWPVDGYSQGEIVQ